MWSIPEIGKLAAQLVRMLRSVHALARVRLGLSHPIWFAQVCKAGWAPPLSVLAGVEVAHEERLVGRVTLMFVDFPHDEVLDVGEWVGLV